MGDLPLIPDEPLAHDPRNIWCDLYGLNSFGKLFNARQLLALTTFTRLVGKAHGEMLAARLDEEYAKAVATYLGLIVDRLADYNATVSRWGNDDEGITGTFARQAIPMVWDYGEAQPYRSIGRQLGEPLVGSGEWIDNISRWAMAGGNDYVRRHLSPPSSCLSVDRPSLLRRYQLLCPLRLLLCLA